jgi:hypothetical protein
MWHPVKQNTEDPCPCCGKTWPLLRSGKVTGSSIGKVMAWHNKPLKTGPKWGDPAHRLAVEIAVVELGGSATENDYSNSHMERGHEQEPIARALYEKEYFCSVSDGGFFDNGRTGSSPDGLVYEEGEIEIKSVLNHIHYERIEKGGLDPKYRWQNIFNLKESGREWMDYVSFCATFAPRNKRLFVYRILADDVREEFSQIDKRLAEFWELVEDKKKTIRG